MTQFCQSIAGLCRACRVFTVKGDEQLCGRCLDLSRERAVRLARITEQLAGLPVHARDDKP